MERYTIEMDREYSLYIIFVYICTCQYKHDNCRNLGVIVTKFGQIKKVQIPLKSSSRNGTGKGGGISKEANWAANLKEKKIIKERVVTVFVSKFRLNVF